MSTGGGATNHKHKPNKTFSEKIGFFFPVCVCHTVTVRLAGPWHGCPPFPLHSKAMVTCSGWFLYRSGRLSSNSCSVATCCASRATAILKRENESSQLGGEQDRKHACAPVHTLLVILLDVCSFKYLACSCKMQRSCCTSSAAALVSVRQLVGTSATGGFGVCSSGAVWGTGCFCRLERMRSLAATNGEHKAPN